MKRKKHNAEQIIKKLREADAMLAGGKTIDQYLQAFAKGHFHRAAAPPDAIPALD
jgi:hypothetical protein